MAEPDPLEAARRIAPVLSAGAEEAERLGTLPAASVGALQASGLFGLLVPAELGGMEAGLPTLIEVVSELSRADGSAAWCLGNAALGSGTAGAQLPSEGARRVFAGRGDVPMAGGFVPRNRARPVEGGYELSGRWAFGSGCRHAEWIVVTAATGEGEAAPGAIPEARVFLVPRERVEIHDNWQAAGLEGTASCDYSLDECSVAAELSFPLLGSAPLRGGALHRLPMLTVAAAVHGSFALGLGARALDEIAGIATGRLRLGSAERLAERGSFQQQFGRAAAALRAARLLVTDAFGDVWRTAEAGDPASPRQGAEALLATVHANRTSADVARFAFRAAGATALFRSHPLQRCLRDVEAAGQHIVVGDESFERGAQVLLGLPPHPMV